MTKQSRPKKVTRTVDPETALKVKSFRDSLGMSQARFAERLNVQRTQVAAWEGGKEGIPVEKLLAMVRLAPRIEDRLWFLEKAGVPSEEASAAYREQSPLKFETSASDTDALISLMGTDRTDKTGIAKLALLAHDGTQVTAQFAGHSGSTVVAIVQQETKLVGRLPFPLRVGDLVIVDRTKITLDDFLESHSSLGERLAAIYLPEVPRWLEPESLAEMAAKVARAQETQIDLATYRHLDAYMQMLDPKRFAESKKSNEELYAGIEEQMKKPVLLFGFIQEQRAGGENYQSLDRTEKPAPWRLWFSVGNSLGIPLSDWSTGTFPRTRHEPMLHGARIFGAVVGWVAAQHAEFKQNSRIPPKETP